MELEQREEPLRLGLARERVGDHAGEPQRVVGEVAVGRGIAAGDEVRLAVHDRDDRQHDVEPLRPLRRLGDPQRNPGRADLALGPDDPLRDGRLGAAASRGRSGPS